MFLPLSLAVPPMAWIPSCELPAMRMTASEIRETFGVWPDGGAVKVASLMKTHSQQSNTWQGDRNALKPVQRAHRCPNRLSSAPDVSNSNPERWVIAKVATDASQF